MRSRPSPARTIRRLRRDLRRSRELRAEHSRHWSLYEDLTNEAYHHAVVCVLGMKRSGNHAVTSWLLENCRRPSLFLNNVRTDLHPNPYLSVERAVYEDETGWTTTVTEKDRAAPEVVRQLVTRENGLGTLVHSHEDPRLDHGSVLRLEEAGRLLGIPGRSDYLLVMRDFYNLAASRLEHPWIRVGTRERETWKTHAEEALGETRRLGRGAVVASYNRWCRDTGHREGLSRLLGLPTHDREPGEVGDYGGGSSFDGTGRSGDELAGRSGERWRGYRRDPEWRRLCGDPRTQRLCRRLFGLSEAERAAG